MSQKLTQIIRPENPMSEYRPVERGRAKVNLDWAKNDNGPARDEMEFLDDQQKPTPTRHKKTFNHDAKTQARI